MKIKGEIAIRGTRKVYPMGGSRGITLPAHLDGFEVGTEVRLYRLPGGGIRLAAVLVAGRKAKKARR